MDKKTRKYSHTKLNKVYFDIEKYEDEMEFSLNISHTIQESKEEDYKNEIIITGELNAMNSVEEVATIIIMTSLFKTLDAVEEKDIKNDDFYYKPILNQITLLMATITDKMFNLPMLLPIFSPDDLEEKNSK